MLLEIDGLTKSYHRALDRRPSVRANDGISLRVDAGEVMGLLGHNGAGKTTLVNQVVGLLAPDGGTITIDGRDAVADPGFARQICSLQPQAQVPLAGLTPRRAIDMLGRLRGGRLGDIRARRDWLAEALDIGEWLDTDGSRLSGGVKRLVSFAMAAVVPGRVVILDEPTNDVDPVRRRHLWNLVRTLADEGGAVLLVTHNVLEAERAVDHLVILDRGRVIAAGTPGELRDDVGSDLRLELALGPGVAAPAPPPSVHRFVTSGSHAVAMIPAGAAAEAIAWASALREFGEIEEFSLAPASLEDVYVQLVGRPASLAGVPEVGRERASTATEAPEREVIDGRAA